MNMKDLNGVSQLHVELAARCTIDITYPDELNSKKVMVRCYRFDTRTICGDFTLVYIATPFASEEAARMGLLSILSTIA